MSVSLTEKIEIVAKGLTYLSLEGLITLPPSELESIVRNCPNLTKLYTPRKSQKQDGYSISIFMYE